MLNNDKNKVCETPEYYNELLKLMVDLNETLVEIKLILREKNEELAKIKDELTSIKYAL